ncbi:MAG: hypothetical protein HN790_14320 [Methylococcales bacterium]|nr:hypothetical protein [Methylococcales bacterium]
MHSGKPIKVISFDSEENPLQSLESAQSKYLKAYLVGAGVRAVAIEHNYFDRDYLDEFSAFYGKSARGYDNICQRLHFFSDDFTSRLLRSAISGREKSISRLQKAYLGFVVRRPLDVAPFGRTVLSWYVNKDEHSERITPALRPHGVNILGVKLTVLCIPWQQQDRGVSSCATIALWSMFHSSAFDAHHAVPTTVEITKNAHQGSSGSRAFPSKGLNISELQEAIFSQNLTPKLLPATKAVLDQKCQKQIIGFEVTYLASMCAANIRSGYPVLLVGDYTHAESDQQHAICCIGFREKEQATKAAGTFSTMDEDVDVFYIHDDNIGPNVRCKLIEDDGLAVLVTDPPDYVDLQVVEPRPDAKMKFRPSIMLIAVHNEIRMDAESLVYQGRFVASELSVLLNNAYDGAGLPLPALTYTSQFLDVRHFMSEYLGRIFSGDKTLLGKVRLSIGSDVPPLCLHVGLVTVGIVGNPMSRMLDVIYDTTDSAMVQIAIAHIVYDEQLKLLFDSFDVELISQLFGQQVIGYE